MPLLGRAARSPRMLRKGYRCFVLDDYLLYYKIEGDEVAIWHVRHSVRRPPDSDQF
jgi:plasmid stabilization system protein ParE